MTKSILIVDDESHILRAAEFKFQRAGFQVYCAEDGQKAWEMILKHRPDLVITDYQMPRLDGLQLIERVRATAPLTELPIILLTAKGFEMPRQEICQRYGLLAVLTKPFSPRELHRRAQLALGLISETSPAAEVAP